MAFSPFRRGQSPELNREPTVAQVRADLELLAGVTREIRTYTVRGVLAQVPAIAADLHLRVTVGAWLSGDRAADEAELGRLIAVARTNSDVARVLVGNETVLRGDLTVPELLTALTTVKLLTDVPVSTAEPWHVWLAHPELAAAVDVITVHLLPYWEGLDVDDALRFTFEKLEAVQAAFPTKPILIGEVGWPSNGVAIGAARASRVNQAKFMRGFLRSAGERGLNYFVMEAFDQPWKTSFEGRAAGYWGMFDLDRSPKWTLSGSLRERPNWLVWAVSAAVIGSLISILLLYAQPNFTVLGQCLVAAAAQAVMSAFTALLIVLSDTYLTSSAICVWASLVAAQLVLLLLLVADCFECAELLCTRAGTAPMTLKRTLSRHPMPKVSVHVPICNEPPEMVIETLAALADMDYPEFEVLVIDNNTSDPALWEPVAAYCASLGPRFRFFHLGCWPGYKAGALNVAFCETAEDAEIVAVVDGDYIVARDWLRETVTHFNDPAVGFVQSPQDYRDQNDSVFKRIMFWEYAGFFRIGMVNRDARNAIIMHGTMVLIRRAAIEQAGGWAEWSICEDAELGLRLLLAGWRGKYLPRSFGRGLMPDDFAALCRQRFRWAGGAVQIMLRHWRPLLSPFNRGLLLGQRWHFVTGWLPWIADGVGLGFVLLGLVWSIGLTLRPRQFEFPVLALTLPIAAVFALKMARSVMLYRAKVPCGAADRLGAAIAGLALSHTIAKAVWRGVFTSRPTFLRTPKCAHAPVLIQGLAMAWEELLVLISLSLAMACVGFTHHFATWETKGWILLLGLQALPYAASVALGLGAAIRSSQQGGLRVSLPVGHFAAAGTEVMASTGNAD